MAFYISIKKLSETDKVVDYIFDSRGYSGRLSLNKEDGEVVEMVPHPQDGSGHIFSRAAVTIRRAWEKKQIPESAEWAS